MAKARRTKVKDKWKGKEWYEVITPKLFDNAVIGETLTVDPSTLVGRVMETSLIDLGGDGRKYYVKFFFKIDKIEGNRALTVLNGHDTTRDFIARIVNIRTSRVDTNSIIKLKDGKMNVKTITICNRQVKAQIKKNVRDMVLNLVKGECEKLTIDEFVKEMVSDKIQKKIKSQVNKIYPIRYFEFTKTKIL